jgi:hypothetical protein
MRVSNSIALVAIAGGLWANVLSSFLAHRGLASPEGDRDRFEIAGAEGGGVWRLERNTGQIQICSAVPPPAPKPDAPYAPLGMTGPEARIGVLHVTCSMPREPLEDGFADAPVFGGGPPTARPRE